MAENEARIVALDIETYQDVPADLLEALAADIKPRGNLKDPAKIEADIAEKRAALLNKAALSPLTGRVVSWALYLGGEHSIDGRATTADDERTILVELDKYLARSGCTYLATKNGRKFDLPFLAARYALHGIVPAYPLPLGYHRLHIDVQDVCVEALGLWALRFGYAKTANGSDVAGMVERGEWERLVDYNVMDAKITWEIASRLLPILKG